MSFDGLPPYRKCFSSKICFFPLKFQTLHQKMSFPYIDTIKTGPLSVKIDARIYQNSKSIYPLLHKSAPNLSKLAVENVECQCSFVV